MPDSNGGNLSYLELETVPDRSTEKKRQDCCSDCCSLKVSHEVCQYYAGGTIINPISRNFVSRKLSVLETG